ncbi:MAG TPA: DNA polymerase/3'-5' exonuclease PolX [Acidimicrobiales bacterium]|nr:DNA polymerase/3'-5' exonuclease PolX [Acidimicrobiales bacterium]
MARSNDEAAEALTEFADLLSIIGGEDFKVRAYEKAARAVREYPLDIEDLDEAGLEQIPSVGSHIAAKIRSLRETGRIDELDELRATVPAGLRSLLDVPGLGPKRARQVYEALGIASMTELLDALHDERLRELRGWGATSEANLRRAIEQAQQAGGRMLLSVALDVAEDLVAALRRLPGVVEAQYAGSLRRMCETIGDIDLLVASSDPETVTGALAGLDPVAEVPMRGPTKAVALTTKGVHVDLRVVAPEVWGAALMYFTGSKGHNIHLRTIAARHGLKLSEYGLERIDDGTVLAAATEAEVYERLGMVWIPPTLREDRGEIEAAAEGKLPHVVEVSDIRGDLHVHTDLTDGLASLEDMVAAAKARRYRYLAITDHAPLLYMERMTAAKALEQRKRLRALEKKDGIALFHGSELNIQADGSVDWDAGFLSGFDVLVASIHSGFQMSREDMTRRLIAAIEHPAVNIIGHPTARSIGHRAGVEFDVPAVFDAAARNGTALEINSFPDRLDLSDELARLAHERGVVFAVSTDAHSTRHLDNIRFGVATAQRGWVDPASVVNTWPLTKLRRFLAKGHSGRQPTRHGAA